FVAASSLPRLLSSFPTRRSSDLPTPLSPPRASPLSFSKTRLYLGWVDSFMARVRVESENKNEAFCSSHPQDRQMKAKVGQCFSPDRKSTRLNSSHQLISYAVFCL